MYLLTPHCTAGKGIHNRYVQSTTAQWPCVTKAAGCVFRYQLGFALLLRDLLPGLKAPLDTFDPAFDDVDRALLANLGVTVRGSFSFATADLLMQNHACDSAGIQHRAQSSGVTNQIFPWLNKSCRMCIRSVTSAWLLGRGDV